MKKYLVIGNPIKHSLSPLIHNYWMKKCNLIDSIYEKRKVEEEDLRSIVSQIRIGELNGVNITVPFKEKIIPFLDKLDDYANETQSVNTLYKQFDGQIVGSNTDGRGFVRSLTDDILGECHGKNIFILGSGGVTPSIIGAFLVANKIYITNRTKEKAEKLKNQAGSKLGLRNIEVLDWGEKPQVCDFVINTTSVGLKKDENLGLNFKEYENNKNSLFYDLIYNPKETNFLKDARLRGNRTMNGKMMFLHQAHLAFTMWTDLYPPIDDDVIRLLDR